MKKIFLAIFLFIPSIAFAVTQGATTFVGNVTLQGGGDTGTTQSSNDNSTKLATTAYVNAASTTGNAATATALASNPTKCSSGYYTIGINASGTAQSCTIAPTECSTSSCSLNASTTLNGETISTQGFGTLINTKYCTYASGTGLISCDTSGGGGSGLTVGTTTIASGTNTYLEYNNNGVLGEYDISGSGSVAMTTSPTFTGTVVIPTPFTIGAVSMTSTGTQLNYLNAATGTTGTTSTNVVFSGSPTLATPTFTTSFISPLWNPASDSTTAIQIDKADGVTNIVDVDTTNTRVGIGTTSPGSLIDLQGITPASSSGSVGTAADKVINANGGTGGDTTSSGSNATGGLGGAISLIGGGGGDVTAVTNIATGGGGGALLLQGGGGKNPTDTSAAAFQGGFGGNTSIFGGNGGTSNNATGSQPSTGGSGGNITFNGGNGGGSSSNTTSSNTAGNGGFFNINGGIGGNATVGSGSLIGGAGGLLNILGGNGGNGNTGGAGGTCTLAGGNGGNTTVSGGAGGATNISGGSGGSYASSVGGNVTIAAGTGNRNGGSIIFKTATTTSLTTALTIDKNQNLIFPILIGGTAVGSSLTLQSTQGVGTTDFIKFLVGNNGGTEAMRIIDSGSIGIGTNNPGEPLDVNGIARATNIIDTGVTANTLIYANGSQQLASSTIGTGLALSSGTISSNATSYVTYQPGLLSAVNATIGVNYLVSKASTVDNIIGSAVTFSCISNPTVTMYECGTSTTCAAPTTIGTVTVTAAGTLVVGTVSSSAITAGDYIGWAITAGTCASIDIAATAQLHSN